MRTFADDAGREWKIDLTLRAVDRFERETGESIFADITQGRLGLHRAWRLAWYAVRDQAEAAKIKTYEEWLDALGRKAAPKLTQAIVEELADFFGGPEEASKANPTAVESGTGDGSMS